jgi:hypothetical protein
MRTEDLSDGGKDLVAKDHITSRPIPGALGSLELELGCHFVAGGVVDRVKLCGGVRGVRNCRGRRGLTQLREGNKASAGLG